MVIFYYERSGNVAIPKINNTHSPETRNIINETIDVVNSFGGVKTDLSDVTSKLGLLINDVNTIKKLNVKTDSLLKQAEKINNENKSVQSQIDSLILESGTSDAEVIQARGGKPLLKDRLNVYDSDISKINDDFKKSFMYEKIYGTLSRYTKPSAMDLTIPFTVSVAPNGNFDYSYDVSRHKNAVSKRYYVDVNNGDNTNDGTESAPFKDLNRAFRYGDADEIVLKSGYYGWSNGIGLGDLWAQKKNFNLIGDGTVHLGAHRDTQTWETVSGRNNVFTTTASAVVEIIDFNGGYAAPVFYKKVNSIDEVENRRASFFIDTGNVIYVRPNYIGKPNDRVLLNMANKALPIGDHGKVYIENIKFTNTVTHDTTNPGELYCKNVDFAYGTGDNALSIFGDVYFELQNCRALWAERDGFNYHVRGGKLPRGLEIDCEGAYNGRDGANQNNGSTMHDGGKIIRVGGVYRRNHGPNVIDVNDGTQSLNIGVHAHSSKATDTNSNVDFRTRDDADMWLVNCISNGSDFSTSVGSPARLHKQNVLMLSPESVI